MRFADLVVSYLRVLSLYIHRVMVPFDQLHAFVYAMRPLRVPAQGSKDCWQKSLDSLLANVATEMTSGISV